MDRKKIAFVAHGLGNGGAERVASILASKFSECGHAVMFLAIYDKRITYQIDERIEYHYLGFDEYTKAVKYVVRAKSICDYLDKFRPDYVISFITQEMMLAGLFRRYKILYSERTDPAAKSKLLRMMTNFLYLRAEKIVFQTPGARDYFCGKIRKKGRIIANPIDTLRLPFWNEQDHDKSIITACRITPEKNLKMLIKAFSKIVEIHKDYTLKIYGEPRYPEAKRELVELAENLGIAGYIEFPGYQSDIHSIMAKSAVFVLTSNYEGLSNAMLEALCIGIPTICTNCPSGGAAMYIQDNSNGFLVAVNDVDELVQKLQLLIENKDIQRKVSKRSIKLRDRLAVENIVEQWEDLLK